MSREIMQQALTALRISTPFAHALEYYEFRNKAIKDIEAELAKPEQVITPISPDQYERFCGKCGACLGKPWVGLTDKEILDLWIANHKDTGATNAFAYAVEAKLKEKNT